MKSALQFADKITAQMGQRARTGRYVIALVVLSSFAMHSHAGVAAEHSLDVTATAYNSVEAQTSKQPWVAAWGDKLAPGMPVIAVSRDLHKLGLTRGTVVRIEGMEGRFVVLDKMNKRWRRKVDVYMGSDIKGALKFGRRKVTIHWGRRDPRKAEEIIPSFELASTDSPTADSAAVVPETETP